MFFIHIFLCFVLIKKKIKKKKISYQEKNYKKFKIALVTSFILLLTLNRAASLPGLTSNCVTPLTEIDATFKRH